MQQAADSLRYRIALTLVILLLASLPAQTQTRRKTASTTKYVPVTVYDPGRDADKDILNAVREAQRTNKHILLEVGGEWCSWCHRLDKFFLDNADLAQLRDKNFVTVKVNFSEENKNEPILSRYPPISGYPHIFFLDSNGKLLLSQDTSPLESGKSYDLERLTTVLTNWGPSH